MPDSTIEVVGGSSDETRRGDIVFIHGLDGNSRTTWENPENKAFWPSWLSEDIPNVAVWTVGYQASAIPWEEKGMPLLDRGRNILDLLEVNGFAGTKSPLVFVVHSLGGLVVKQLMRSAADTRLPEWQQIYDRIRGVAYLATPHSGTSIRGWLIYLASKLRTNVAELQFDDAYLRDLNKWYQNSVDHTQIASLVYFETEKTYGKPVVNATVADPGIPRIKILGIEADHISICKPASKRAQVYLGVRNFCKKCIEREVDVPNHGLTAYLQMDPQRTSLQCTKRRIRVPEEEDSLDVRDCLEYGLTDQRAYQILWGFDGEVRAKEGDRLAFEKKYFGPLLRPSFQALQAVQRMRGREGVAVDIFKETDLFFQSFFHWKKSLRERDLLPSHGEWEKLGRNLPELGEALRTLYINWIGQMDPYFRLTLQNYTKDEMLVSKVTYVAEYKKTHKAMMLGASEKPPYILVVRDGKHMESLDPPIPIKPQSSKRVGLLMRLEKPRPGALYTFNVSFATMDGKHKADLPEFGIVFFAGKMPE